MQYTLRQLEVFLAVAHFENISKAADSLAMSQSAASGALKELEKQFDVQLFDRVGKKVQLNSFGRSLQASAESLMAHASSVQQQLLDPVGGQWGGLSVGATLTIGNYLAVPLIVRYQQGAGVDLSYQNNAQLMNKTGRKVSLSIANTEEIVRRVVNFELDIGLIEGEISHDSLNIYPWQEDELTLFCSVDHPLALQGELNEQSLSHVQWILRERGSGTRQAFERGMQGLLPQLTITYELEQTEAIKQAVKAGLGISCLPKVALKSEFEHGELVPLTIPNRRFERHLYVIIHQQKFISANIRHWMTLCCGDMWMKPSAYCDK